MINEPKQKRSEATLQRILQVVEHLTNAEQGDETNKADGTDQQDLGHSAPPETVSSVEPRSLGIDRIPGLGQQRTQVLVGTVVMTLLTWIVAGVAWA